MNTQEILPSKEEIDWDEIFVNFVDGIVFYKNNVFDLETFKEEYGLPKTK